MSHTWFILDPCGWYTEMTKQDSWHSLISVISIMRIPQPFFSCLSHTHLHAMDYATNPMSQQQPIVAVCMPHSLT